MDLHDASLKYFGKYAKSLQKRFPFIEKNLRKASLHTYVDTYYSLMMFLIVLSLIPSMAFTALALFFKAYALILIAALVPVFIFAGTLIMPIFKASNRGSNLDAEFPFTANYLSTIVMSGLSPFTSLERLLRASTIFKHSAELAQRFVLLNKMLGKDPLTAFAELAERTPSNKVKETFSGYIATVKAGGDVVDFMNKRARMLFQELLVGIKIIADRLAGLLESYLALALLTMISFSVLYFVTAGFAGVVPFGLNDFQMFLFLYIIMPFVSFIIIYLADIIQFKDPYMDWRPIIFYLAVSLPLSSVLILLGIILAGTLLSSNPLISSTRYILLLGRTDAPLFIQPSLMLCTALIIGTIPSIAYYIYISRDYKVVNGVTRFLRDLVEVRKTGLPPEKCIIELSSRDYGVFTPHLRKIALELSLGISLPRIIEGILKNVKSWIAQAMLFTLTDTIEVGGGSVEVLENLAWFAESVEAIEEEKKRSLRTLLIVPYMGALLSSFTIIYMVSYMTNLPYQVGGFARAAGVVLPSIVLNSYIMGLVAGKVSSGRLAAGYLHAVLLTLANLLLFIFMGLGM